MSNIQLSFYDNIHRLYEEAYLARGWFDYVPTIGQKIVLSKKVNDNMSDSFGLVKDVIINYDMHSAKIRSEPGYVYVSVLLDTTIGFIGIYN